MPRSRNYHLGLLSRGSPQTVLSLEWHVSGSRTGISPTSILAASTVLKKPETSVLKFCQSYHMHHFSDLANLKPCEHVIAKPLQVALTSIQLSYLGMYMMLPHFPQEGRFSTGVYTSAAHSNRKPFYEIQEPVLHEVIPQEVIPI